MKTKVYMIDLHAVVNKSHSSLSDEEFMAIAENQDTVYTLKEFQVTFNVGIFDASHFAIRFLNGNK